MQDFFFFFSSSRLFVFYSACIMFCLLCFQAIVGVSRTPPPPAPRMTADVLGTPADPWSPGYVTPASTPSPRTPRSQPLQDDPGPGAAAGAAAAAATGPSSGPVSAAAHPEARPRAAARAPTIPTAPTAPTAVSVRRAHHVYVNYNFNGKTTVPVLSDFNMTVRQGNM